MIRTGCYTKNSALAEKKLLKPTPGTINVLVLWAHLAMWMNSVPFERCYMVAALRFSSCS